MRAIFGLFVLIVIFAAMSGSKDKEKAAATAPEPVKVEKKEPPPPPPPPPTPKPGEVVTEEYFKHFVTAEVMVACANEIRRLVKYDIRSPGTFYGTNSGQWAILRFDRWGKHVDKDNNVLIAGDEAEAQNGFGNWLRINYSCWVNVATKKPVHAMLDQGRIQR